MDSSLIIILVIIAIFMFPAFRSGKSAVKAKPKKLISFVTPRPPAEAMKVIARYAEDNGYQIEDADYAGGRIILADAATRNSWGFFYPIYVSSQEQDGALIEVGIKSRLVQIGRLVATSHQKCANGVQAALESEA